MSQQKGGMNNPDDPNRHQGAPKPRKPAAPTVDPMAELNRLLASLQGGNGSNDYYADASRIYQPQFSYLDQLGQGAEGRAKQSGKDLSGLYGALQSGIRGQEGGIKRNYDQGINSAGGAYNQALDAVGQSFDNTRNNSAEVLSRLGIEQAAPNVMGESNQAEALIEGILGANQLGTTNALRQGKQAAVTYNTQQAGAAGLAGAEAQTGLKRQLADFMNQLSGKRADLQSQVFQTEQSMESDAQKSALQQAQDEYSRMKDDRDFNYRMAKDKADYDLRAKGTANDPTVTDPMGKLQQLGMNLYGNSQAAGNAIEAISAAMGDTQKLAKQGALGGKQPTLQQLLNVLKERLTGANGEGNVRDWSSLQRLAALYLDN